MWPRAWPLSIHTALAAAPQAAAAWNRARAPHVAAWNQEDTIVGQPIPEIPAEGPTEIPPPPGPDIQPQPPQPEMPPEPRVPDIGDPGPDTVPIPGPDVVPPPASDPAPQPLT